MARPGKRTQPWCVPYVAASRRKVGAPRGDWGLRPEAEKGQGGLVEDGKGKAEGDENDDRSQSIGENLAEDDRGTEEPTVRAART